MLRDTLYKQSSLDREQCWVMLNYLATALGNLLIFPIDMYLIYVTVSVFYFAISLDSLLSSSGVSLRGTLCQSERVSVLSKIY